MCCAIIKNDNGEILITQRSESMSMPLKWEFPGGKIEKNETAQECIIREVKEELSIEIKILSILDSVRYEYPEFTIKLIPFTCKIRFGEIKLTQHSNYLWLAPKELLDLDLAEADLPILNNFLQTL